MLPYTTNAYHRISPLPYNLVPLPINTIFSTTQLITPLSTIIICYLFSHLLFPDWTAITTICPTHIHHKPTLQPREWPTSSYSPAVFRWKSSPCRCASQKVCVGPHLGGRSEKIRLAVSSPVY